MNVTRVSCLRPGGLLLSHENLPATGSTCSSPGTFDANSAASRASIVHLRQLSSAQLLANKAQVHFTATVQGRSNSPSEDPLQVYFRRAPAVQAEAMTLGWKPQHKALEAGGSLPVFVLQTSGHAGCGRDATKSEPAGCSYHLSLEFHRDI